MKPKGLSYEYWNPALSLVVDAEPDQPDALFRSGEFASRIIHIALAPYHIDGTPLENEWYQDIADGINKLDEWLTPDENNPGTYFVQDGVQIIFRDNGLQTYNGYPQAHVRGPAELKEDT